MKHIFQKSKSLLSGLCLMVVMMGVAITFTSCEEEESYGTPVISNIRVTDPVEGQNPLTIGSLGQMVVIQGENLGSTTKVMFNNVEAFVNPSLVTDKNIIVTIPDEFPTEINDMVAVVTKGGETTHNFPIDIPAPSDLVLPLEYAPEGAQLTIKGRFLYNVESVTFAGDVNSTNITTVSPQEIKVVVPADAQPGPVTVNAVAGASTTTAWFRDNRNMMVNFDDMAICWGGVAYVVDATAIPGDVPVEPISGNFYYIKKDYIANSWWIEETVIAYCGDISVSGSKANYALAFEMWVGEKWDSNWYEIEMFGSASLDPVYFEWRGYQTLGGDDEVLENTGWMTVKIPLESMESLNGDNFRMGRFGSYKAQVEDTIEFAIDNLRLIPLD
jgi:hypothetical protein